MCCFRKCPVFYNMRGVGCGCDPVLWEYRCRSRTPKTLLTRCMAGTPPEQKISGLPSCSQYMKWPLNCETLTPSLLHCGPLRKHECRVLVIVGYSSGSDHCHSYRTLASWIGFSGGGLFELLKIWLLESSPPTQSFNIELVHGSLMWCG